MNDSQQLADFHRDLHQDLIAVASAEGEEVLLPDAFTDRMIAELVDVGALDDAEVCHLQGPGFAVSGYGVSDEDGTLDLLTTIYDGGDDVARLPRSRVDDAIRRLRVYLDRARQGLHATMEEASPAYDMTLRIAETARQIDHVRMFVLTDAVTSAVDRPSTTEDGLTLSYHVWDLERLFRAVGPAGHPESIHVDFTELAGGPIPCIAAPAGGGDYRAYLAIIPGRALAELYLRYGPRLLELNVRSFLQARGKVNTGIRRTILDEPDHFLAYNNGISITASSIDLTAHADGGAAIDSIDDLQIVNGGQTTASIYSAWRKDRANVDQLSVAAKVTVVAPSLIERFVPLISRYANSQNKVNEADFSANDPFHVEVEKLSRRQWAPAPEGTQRQTKWFYERARGQYQDALSREETPARKAAFRQIFPPLQRFTKTDLAKFENTWAQLPHLVSRGAEKNFREFAIRLAERGRVDVTDSYFQRLVARAILFRATERLVSSLAFGAYRANIVTYSIAYLGHQTAHRLDLDRIWARQALSDETLQALREIAPIVFSSITDPPGGRNVTEWCKRPECWDRIRDLAFRLPQGLERELVNTGKPGEDPSPTTAPLDAPDPTAVALIERIAAVEKDVWFALSHWAKETGNLAAWQRGLAFSLGRQAGRRPPTAKQAVQADRMLAEATRLGFRR